MHWKQTCLFERQIKLARRQLATTFYYHFTSCVALSPSIDLTTRQILSGCRPTIADTSLLKERKSDNWYLQSCRSHTRQDFRSQDTLLFKSGQVDAAT